MDEQMDKSKYLKSVISKYSLCFAQNPENNSLKNTLEYHPRFHFP